MDDSVDRRLDRLESIEAIRQLVSRYALALDSRDVETLVSLFADNVQTPEGVGHDAMIRWFDPVLRPYRITFHFIGNHVINFVDDDHATGVVYCRPEHEVGDEWIVMPMQYWDRYERENGRWCFRSRSPKVFYAADVTQRPQDAESRFNFPGNPMIHAAELPERWETWQSFWAAETG